MLWQVTISSALGNASTGPVTVTSSGGAITTSAAVNGGAIAFTAAGGIANGAAINGSSISLNAYGGAGFGQLHALEARQPAAINVASTHAGGITIGSATLAAWPPGPITISSQSARTR